MCKTFWKKQLHKKYKYKRTMYEIPESLSIKMLKTSKKLEILTENRNTGSLALWSECSQIVRETGVHSQVESYQRLKNGTRYFIPRYYKVCIKGKVEQSRERSKTLPPLLKRELSGHPRQRSSNLSSPDPHPRMFAESGFGSLLFSWIDQ